jgi:hypothetical protein
MRKDLPDRGIKNTNNSHQKLGGKRILKDENAMLRLLLRQGAPS